MSETDDTAREHRWLFRAHLGWRRGCIEAARAKQRRDEARARLERWKQGHEVSQGGDMSNDDTFNPIHWPNLGVAEAAAIRDALDRHALLPRARGGDWMAIEPLIQLAFIRGINTQKYGPDQMLDERGNWIWP